MIIFVDANNNCHVTEAEGTRAFDVAFFDGKCKEFVEGYRYFPESNMVTPWKPYTELVKAQTEYEAEERIKKLEAENAMLLECVLEMSAVVYA